jgi:hypothetical protein
MFFCQGLKGTGHAGFSQHGIVLVPPFGNSILQQKKRSVIMPKSALFVRLEARPGKEKEVEQFLKSGLSVVQGEPATISWYAVKMGPSVYGIFDTFPDDAGRQAHLTGEVAKALNSRATELFMKAPTIEKADILASKLPEPEHVH